MLFSLASVPVDCLKVVERIDALRQQLRYATSDQRRKWTDRKSVV